MLPSRQVLLGMTIGALCASAVAAIGPGMVLETFADEQPVGIDTSNLVRFEGRDYDVQYDDWVATDPVSRTSVKKIEFGRVSYVDVTTTATGTYSSEAMFSPHVQYPGISVEQTPAPAFGGAIAALGERGRWVALPLVRASSFVHIRAGRQRVLTDGRDTCVLSRSYTIC